MQTKHYLGMLNAIMMTITCLDVIALANDPIYTDLLSFVDGLGEPPFSTLSNEEVDKLDAMDLEAIQRHLEAQVEDVHLQAENSTRRGVAWTPQETEILRQLQDMLQPSCATIQTASRLPSQ
jgi:hypothetical protein